MHITNDSLRTRGEPDSKTKLLCAMITVCSLALFPNIADAQSTNPSAESSREDAEQRSQNGEPNGISTVPLEEIRVEGDAIEDGTTGFVSEVGGTGAKTDTPIAEVPQSLSVITRDRLDAQGLDSISDVFRYTPGVIGEGFGNDTRVDFLFFRGFNDGGDAVFRDGLALRSTPFGQFKPELFGVEQVEVLRGPSSSLYGLGNPGGLVNLISKRPTKDFFAEAALEVGSFDQRGGRFDVSGVVNDAETVSARFTGLVREGDTQTDFVDDDRSFFAPALTFEPNDRTALTFLGFVQQDDTGSTNQFLPSEGTLIDNPNGEISTDTFVGEPDFDDYQRDVYSFGYLFEHEASDSLKFNQSVRYNDLDVDSETVFGAGLQEDLRTLNRFAFTADSEIAGLTVDTNAQIDVAFGPTDNRILIGFDYLYYDLDEEQGFDVAPAIDVFDPVYGADIAEPPIFSDINTKQRQQGVYLQDQITIYDNLIVTLTGRFDMVDTEVTNELTDTSTEQDDEEFSGRAGLAYKTPFGFTPFVGYTESFQPELGTDVDGNLFEPTTAKQVEAGVRYQPPGVNALIALTAFNLVRENLLTEDPANPLNDIQIGEARSRGIEVEANASFDSGWALNASYTYLDAEITESNDGDEGNQLGQAPEHEAAAFASYSFDNASLRGLRLGAGIRYRGETTNNANDVDIDDFVLVDAIANYRWSGFDFTLQAENLLNNEHVASCSSSSACFYGTDRKIIARLGIRW